MAEPGLSEADQQAVAQAGSIFARYGVTQGPDPSAADQLAPSRTAWGSDRLELDKEAGLAADYGNGTAELSEAQQQTVAEAGSMFERYGVTYSPETSPGAQEAPTASLAPSDAPTQTRRSLALSLRPAATLSRASAPLTTRLSPTRPACSSATASPRTSRPIPRRLARPPRNQTTSSPATPPRPRPPRLTRARARSMGSMCKRRCCCPLPGHPVTVSPRRSK